MLPHLLVPKLEPRFALGSDGKMPIAKSIGVLTKNTKGALKPEKEHTDTKLYTIE
jgi:hypothetical protein